MKKNIPILDTMAKKIEDFNFKKWISDNKIFLSIFLFSILIKSIPILLSSSTSLNSDAAMGPLSALHLVNGTYKINTYGFDYGLGGPEYLLEVFFFLLFWPSNFFNFLASALVLFSTEIIFYFILKDFIPNSNKRNLVLFLFIILSSSLSSFAVNAYNIHLNNVFFTCSLAYLTMKSSSWFDRPIAKGLTIGMGICVSSYIFILLIPTMLVMFIRKVSFKKEWTNICLFFVSFIVGILPKIISLLSPSTIPVGNSPKLGGFVLANIEHIVNKGWEDLTSSFPIFLYEGEFLTYTPVYLGYIIVLICVIIYSAKIVIDHVFHKKRCSYSLFFLLIFYLVHFAMLAHALVYDSGVRYIYPSLFFVSIACGFVLFPQKTIVEKKSWYSKKEVFKLGCLVVIITCSLLSQSHRLYKHVVASLKGHEELTELIRIINQKNCQYGWSDYWLSYSIIWQTREHIIMAPIYSSYIKKYADEMMQDHSNRCYIFHIEETNNKTTQLNKYVFKKFNDFWQLHNMKITRADYRDYQIFFEDEK